MENCKVTSTGEMFPWEVDWRKFEDQDERVWGAKQ